MEKKIKTWKYKLARNNPEIRNWLKKLLYKPRTHDDDRRRGTFDVFKTPLGDINYSFIYPETTVAWHRHKKQSDFWYVIKGSLKVGLYHPDEKRLVFVYLHEHERQTLMIPPGVWHGYKNLSHNETILSYYISKKFDEQNPDEERAAVGSFGDKWDVEVK